MGGVREEESEGGREQRSERGSEAVRVSEEGRGGSEGGESE